MIAPSKSYRVLSVLWLLLLATDFSFSGGALVWGPPLAGAAEPPVVETTQTAAGETAVDDTFAIPAEDESDPYLRLNKKTFDFNDGLDRVALRPVAKAYDTVLPTFLSRGVTNFFSNLAEPRVVLNDLLQGKFGQAVGDSVRFLINSTVGLAGLIDVSTSLGLERHNEDFGQTLGIWGAEKSSYVVLPVLGPSSLRDSIGELIDFFTYPLLYWPDVGLRNGLYLVQIIDRRANLLSATDIVDQAAGEDRYEFLREAYRQRRRDQVYDGNPPLEEMYLFEDETLGEEAPGATTGP